MQYEPTFQQRGTSNVDATRPPKTYDAETLQEAREIIRQVVFRRETAGHGIAKLRDLGLARSDAVHLFFQTRAEIKKRCLRAAQAQVTLGCSLVATAAASVMARIWLFFYGAPWIYTIEACVACIGALLIAGGFLRWRNAADL